MADHPLQRVRVTAERVRRFLEDLEIDPSDANRARWRDAMEDLRTVIREARSAGASTRAIHHATGELEDRRFARPPAEARAWRQPADTPR